MKSPRRAAPPAAVGALAILVVAASSPLLSCATRPRPPDQGPPIASPGGAASVSAGSTADAAAAAAALPKAGTSLPDRGPGASAAGAASAAPASAAAAQAASAAPAARGTASASGSVASPAPAAATRDAYMEAALADYRRDALPNGAIVAVKRQSGRRTAAARIFVTRDLSAGLAEAGLDALALSTAAAGIAGSGVLDGGISLGLRLEDYDDVALELVCPAEKLPGILELVASALAAPSFPQAEFDRTLREARVAERRESGDPLLRAAAELRSGLYAGHPYALPPRGTAASLAAATRDSVMRYWSSRFSAERLTVVAVCDADPEVLARRIGAAFGAVRGRGDRPAGAADRPAAAPLPIRPWFKALPLSAMPGSAIVRGEFGAPAPSSPDFGPMAVALAMLDDLLLERLRGTGLAYGAWTRLSSAAAPSASLSVYKTGDPSAAKAAVDAAIADLASGLCLDSGAADGRLGPIARSLEAYKARAITASYSRGASSEGMAARIARDLAAGGDGTALFRAAGRIRAVAADEVTRAARKYLREGPSAWVALGDPELVMGLSPAAFAVSR